jgi:hypothetical protein
MLFMNEYEIDRAVTRHQSHPVLSVATKFLSEFRDEVNAHSDGWCHWPAPLHAAAKLMTLVEQNSQPTEADLKKALAPIKSFYTRRGYAAGMKYPEVK